MIINSEDVLSINNGSKLKKMAGKILCVPKIKCSITPAKLKTPAKNYFHAKNYFPAKN